MSGSLTHKEGGAPAPAAELEAHLDRYLGALRPWATGTRFTSFAERRGSLETCVPAHALERLGRIRGAVDPDRLLVASHSVSPMTKRASSSRRV